MVPRALLEPWVRFPAASGMKGPAQMAREMEVRETEAPVTEGWAPALEVVAVRQLEVRARGAELVEVEPRTLRPAE